MSRIDTRNGAPRKDAPRRRGIALATALLFSALGAAGPASPAGTLWTDDFESGSLADWTVQNPYYPWDDPVTIEASGQAAHTGDWGLLVSSPVANGYSGDAWGPTVDLDVARPYSIEFWFRYESFHWYVFVQFAHVALVMDQPQLPMQYFHSEGDHRFLGATRFDSYCPSATWTRFRIDVDPVAGMFDVYADDALVGSGDYGTRYGCHAFRAAERSGGSTDYVVQACYDEIVVSGDPGGPAGPPCVAPGEPYPYPPACSVAPWDAFGKAFASPGGQSQVDVVDITVRDSSGTPLGGLDVAVNVAACQRLCVDPVDAGLSGQTDGLGRVTLDPAVGGCDSCAVRVYAGGHLIRQYAAITGPDNEGPWASGVVDSLDEAFFHAQLGGTDPCADYDGDGSVGASDEAMFLAALGGGDANSAPCRVPSRAASAVEPWDLFGHAFASPGTASGVDTVTVSVVDQFGSPFEGVPVALDGSACPGLCIGSGGSAGTTDADGHVALDPEVGGYCAGDVRVMVQGGALRTFAALLSPDFTDVYGADGLVNGCDRAFFDAARLANDPRADYDGDGVVTQSDQTLFDAAFAAADSNAPACHPPPFVVQGWDEAGVAAVSPGAAGSFDRIVVTVRDTCTWQGLPDQVIGIDLSACHPLCVDMPDDGLTGTTDASGTVTLNPRVGGCAPCPVVVTANDVVRRTYPRIASADWDGSRPDGTVGGADWTFFQQALGTTEPCADYDGSGSVTVLDFAMFNLAFGNSNVRLCDPAATDVPALPEGLQDTEPRLALGANPAQRLGDVRIHLYSPAKGRASLVVYSVAGRRVATLLDGVLDAGARSLDWRCRDASGGPVAAGVYFLRLSTPRGSVVERLVLRD
jgi:hypothetical protein